MRNLILLAAACLLCLCVTLPADAQVRAHWSYPGDIYSHLVADHGQSSYYLAGLNEAQAKTLHDSLHEQGRFRPAQVGQRWPVGGWRPLARIRGRLRG